MENMERKQVKIKKEKENANKIRVIRIKWVDGKLIKLALEIIASTRSKKYLKRLK
jgi:hypothetical protein